MSKQNSAVSIPIIDIRSASAATELVQAMEGVGCATLIGHGISTRSSFAASRQFFQLDADRKMTCAYNNHESNRGYIPLGNISHSVFLSYDRKEAFDIGKEGEVGMATPWPDDHLSSKEFKEPLLAFWKEMNVLHLRVLNLLGKGLNLEDPAHFANRSDQGHCNLRLTHFPGTQPDNGEGANCDALTRTTATSHEDDAKTTFGTLLLAAQDASGGLSVQSRADKEWLEVPPTEGALVVLVGEMLERWTNGRLRATRYITGATERQELNYLPEKYSIAFFCNANKDVTLEPVLDSTTNKEYPSVNAFDYLTRRLAVTIDTGDEEYDDLNIYGN